MAVTGAPPAAGSTASIFVGAARSRMLYQTI
jgi:hypothetical protein